MRNDGIETSTNTGTTGDEQLDLFINQDLPASTPTVAGHPAAVAVSEAL